MNLSKKKSLRSKNGQASINDFLNGQCLDNKIQVMSKKDSYIPTFLGGQGRVEKKQNVDKELWVDKYKPLEDEDILGNYKNVLWLNRWLDNFKNRRTGTKKGALVSGPPGIGKTSAVKIVLRSQGYEILEINASVSRNKKFIQDQLSEAFSTSKIRFDKNGNFIKQHIAIIMDEVDGMTSGETGGISELTKLLNPLKGTTSVKKIDKENRDNTWKSPIICICNDRYCPKISELSKECEDIKFQKPSNEMLKMKALDILEKENIKNVSDITLSKLISFSDGDLRKLINMLQFSFTNNNKVNEINMSTKYEDIVKTKDHQLFDMTKKIITMGDNFNYKVIQNFAESDISLIPLMISENYVEYVSSGGKFCGTKVLGEIADSISMGDVVNKRVFSDMMFQLSDYYIFSTCVFPSYRIKKVITKHAQQVSLRFPQTLSKNSVIYSNKKTIREFGIKITNINIKLDYFYYIKKIIFSLITSKDSKIKKDGIRIIKSYNITLDDVYSIIRVKLFDQQDYKKLITAKEKTRLLKLWEETQ
tara:strand:- start:3701 stop:5299 length:1599 start_codon:yes stop_codon:yes gene_type:complete